jgi:acyl dehydratase
MSEKAGGTFCARIRFNPTDRFANPFSKESFYMSPVPRLPRGMYFEEFEPGVKIITDGRTITESDIVTFAGLSGDFNTIHTDAEYSKSTPFGTRVAHGLLGLSIASGLATRTGMMDGTVMAFREVNEWKFSLPVRIGDTIHTELEVTEKKALPRLGGGSVLLAVEVKNQNGEVVMKGLWTILVASKKE